MKKSIVALAVLGSFTGVAMAQSSVTLYGRIDQNLTYQEPGNAAKIVSTQTTASKGRTSMKINDGGVNGMGSSRFGLRGVEDLGDGLKLVFKLESQVKGDNGETGGKTQSSTNSLFNREAYVGLESASLGGVRFGRLETLTREANRTVNDASGENEFNIAEALDTYTGEGLTKQIRPLFQNFGTRVDNALSYRSPSFGGLQIIATIGLNENAFAPNGDSTTATTSTSVTTTLTTKNAEYRGLGALLNLGPFNASLTYEELGGGGGKNFDGSFNNVVTVGGNYDFGIATVYAAYQNSSDIAPFTGENAMAVRTTTGKGIDHDAANFGIKVPVGKFTFKVQYTQSTVDGLKSISGSTRNKLDQNKIGAIASYAFSKRTSIYGVMTHRGGDFDEQYTRKNEYAIGIGHNF